MENGQFVWNSYHNTLDSESLISMPLLDGKSGFGCQVSVGPKYKRNAMRIFTRMPSLEDAEAFPVPNGMDPRSVRYEPQILILPDPIRANLSGHFYRVRTAHGSTKLSARGFHKWNSVPESGVYPALVFRSQVLGPDELIEFEGVSFWLSSRGKKSAARYWAHEPPPDILTYYPLTILLVCKLSWIPKEKKVNTRVVDGSYLNHLRDQATQSAPRIRNPAAGLGSLDWRDFHKKRR